MKSNAITTAGAQDIPQLMLLVNSAYRGEEARKGWTHESDLISGTLRTDESSLDQMLKKPDAVILKFEEDEQILGCVYLEKQGDALYLGMLSVFPEKQAKGIGRQLMEAAEEYAIGNNCNSIIMTVISERKLLTAWYERHGYHKTGETRPFHNNSRFGVPIKPVEFIVMKKFLVKPSVSDNSNF